MSKVRLRALRSLLSGSSALTGAGAVSTHRSLAVISTALMASTIMAVSAQSAQAQTQFIDLPMAGMNYTLSANESVQRLTGVAGTQVQLGSYGLAVTNTVDNRFDGVISGMGSLVKNGAGTLILGGANIFIGQTTVSEGTLAIAGNGSISSPITLFNNAVFDISGASSDQTVSIFGGTSGSSVVLGSRTLIFQDNSIYSTSSFNGVISGTGGVTINGSQGVAFGGINTYSGDTTIAMGRLAVTSTGRLGTGAMALTGAGALLDIYAGSASTVSGLSGVDGSRISLNGELTVATMNHSTYAGAIHGSSTGEFVKAGSGILTLTGNNTLFGRTTISGGTLALSGSAASLTYSAVDLASGTTFDISGAGNEMIAGLTGMGGWVLLGANTLAVNNISNGTFAGSILGTGGLTKSGAGTLTLSGENTFTGKTMINGGTLALSGSLGGLTNSAVEMNAPGTTFSIVGAGNETIAGLQGVAGTSVLLGANTLTVNNAVTNSYFGAISGTGGLTKSGAGTLTLYGANTYTGQTTVNAGRLALAVNGSLASGAGLHLGSGAVFDALNVNQYVKLGALSGAAGSQVIWGGVELSFGGTTDATFAGTFSVNGDRLVKNGTGIATLSGDNSGFTGKFRVDDGGLIITSALGGSLATIGGSLPATVNPSVIVTGADAHWALSDSISISRGGSQALRIENGAQVSNGVGIITSELADGVTATVTGQGSRWTNRAALTVAQIGGSATVRILDGGTLSSVGATIGRGMGGTATGLVEVSGNGSSWINTSALYIGDMGGNGTLLIRDGGNVTTGRTYVGYSSGGVGKVSVDGSGSRLNVADILDIGAANASGYGNGEISISNGAVVEVGANGTGTIQLAKEGIVNAAGSTGTLNIGANSDNAQDAVGAGMLNAGVVNMGGGNATLRFNHTDTDYVFASQITGTHNTNVIRQVAGTTILTADNSGYAANIGVLGGALIARGALGGTAYVYGGALQFGDAAGGAHSILDNIYVLSAGSRLGVYGDATLDVTGDISLNNNTILSVHAGPTTPAITAGTLNLGTDVQFNLSGISGYDDLPMTLISTTGGITGDFAAVSVGGFAGAVDYLAVKTQKSSDGLNYLADYGLTWNAGTAAANGVFTLTDAANSFNLGVSLTDQSANSATGWNGQTLTKAGLGRLILSSANTYTGGTYLNAGTLEMARSGVLGAGMLIFGGGTLAASSDITLYNGVHLTSDARYDVTAGADLTLVGWLLGGGNLIKSGQGSLILQHAFGQYADVHVGAGTLQTALGGFSGNIGNAGTVILNIGNDATYAGTISGLNGINGGMEKTGGGNLSLSGVSSLNWVIRAGGISAETTRFTGNADLAGGTSLRFNTIGNQTYGGILSGAGQFILDGNGTLQMGANSAAFGGTTFLNSGTLLVGNALGGSLNVLGGATLGGVGTIGSGAGSVVNIASGGILSPGTSIGILNVNGDLNLASGAFLNMELGAAGSSLGAAGTNDRINVSGSLKLDGTLNLTQSASVADGVAGFGYYRLMTYGGTLSGNGLTIGTTPNVGGAADIQLLTGNGNVDLFIAALGDKTLQHWQGGNGVWNASNTPWLNANGQVASAWGGDIAIFRNNPGGFNGGVVSVEGAQAFKGLQFVDNGYSLAGTGSLVTDAAGSEIRVLADSASITTTITGTGGIIKTQGGTLILSGDNTYAGGTQILAGAVSVSRDANLGKAGTALELNGGALQVTGTSFGTLDRAVSIGTNGGGFDIVDVSHSLTIASAIAGAGDLYKRGEGTLTLTGANAYGNTIIEAGRLNGTTSSVRGNVALKGKDTRLSFTDAGNVAFSGVLSGNGLFSFDGTGTLLLTADSSAFDGTTRINSGTLLIGSPQANGRLGGSLDVMSGATLGGSGIVGSGTGSLVKIASGGIFSPGNSIGTLTVNGDLIFEAGSRYLVEANPLGTDSDRVVVTGTATLNGGTVAHIGATGNYDVRSTYTILDAAHLTGTFGSVTSDFAFLNPKLIYDYSAGTVALELLRNDRDFASVATSRNQIATANTIESIGFDAKNALFDAIVQMADDGDAIRASFDQLSGELHATARTGLIEDSRFVRDAANGRMRSASGQVGASDAPVLAYASDGAQVAVDATYDGVAFWAQSFGSWGTLDNNDSSAELDHQIGGVMVGGDTKLGNWRVGAMGGYSQSEVKLERQKAMADTTTLGVYAGTQWGKLGVRAGMAQSWHDTETQRSVIMTGLSDQLKAEYSGTTRQAFAEAGYSLIARERGQLEAFANLAHVQASTDAVHENGDAAALDIVDADAAVTFASLGLRASRQIVLGHSQASLRGGASWRHASGDLTALNQQAFSAGNEFSIAGAKIAEGSAVIEAGVDIRFSPRTTFGLTYNGQISNTAQDHGFNARLSISF